MASANCLPDALVEGVEDCLGVDERAEAVVVAYEDGAIKAVVDADAGL